MRSFSAWEFFHAMFIPLFPMGTIRAVRHCPTCLRFYKFALKGRKLKAAIAERRAAASGRTDGSVNAVLEDVAAMAHLGDFEGVQALLEELARKGGVVHGLAQARFLELQGLAEDAEAIYRKAAKIDSSSAMPSFCLGRMLLHQGKDAEAIVSLRQAARVSPSCHYLSMLSGMIELRKRQKNWEGLATIMGEILRLEPNMASTKAFSRLFAKACKNSGR